MDTPQLPNQSSSISVSEQHDNQSINAAKRPWIVGGLIIAIIGVGAFATYAYYFSTSSKTDIPETLTQEQSTTSLPSSPARDASSLPDLGLITWEDAAYSQNVYYEEAGIVQSGKYAGYHIVLGAVDFEPAYYRALFVTKDFKTFVLDTATSSVAGNIKDLEKSFYAKIESTVARDAVSLEIPPDVIKQGPFVFIKHDVRTNANLGTTSPVSSTLPNMQFFHTGSGIDVETPEGLVFSYDLHSKELVSRVGEDWIVSWYKGYISWDKGRSEYESSDFAMVAGSLYHTYGSWFLSLYPTAISPDDLIPIVQTKEGLQLYTFKDPNNKSNLSLYDRKFFDWQTKSYATSTSVLGVDGNRTSIPTPSLPEYVVHHPQLFFQGPWSYWYGVHETDYPDPPSRGI